MGVQGVIPPPITFHDLNTTYFGRYKRRSSVGKNITEYPALSFALHLRRRALFYMYNIIIPCVMLSVSVYIYKFYNKHCFLTNIMNVTDSNNDAILAAV
jgi:hypothetical protein